tara:strand:- start:830 stop:934 length:105 start_codon:yes stop_codon:yes gene_type:complete
LERLHVQERFECVQVDMEKVLALKDLKIALMGGN